MARDVHEWLAEGIAAGFCSVAVCVTHDGLPPTADEVLGELEEDPCIPGVRLYEDGAGG